MRPTNIQTLAFVSALLLLRAATANPILTPGVWTAISPQDPTIPYGPLSDENCGQGMAIDPNNPSTLYFCLLQHGLYKTTDAGSSWRKICKVQRDWHNLDTLGGAIRVRIDPKNSNHLYMGQGVIGWDGFFVSMNGGDSVYTPKGFADFQTAAGIGTFDVYDIAVDPADFNHVLLTSHSAWAWGSATYGNGSGVVESKDGGNTWRACSMQPAWGTGTNVWFLTSGATWLLGTQSDGFWRTSDSGSTWTQVSTLCISHGGSQLYKAKNGVLYAACGSGIIRSTDNGVKWNQVGPMTFCGSVYGDGNYVYTLQAYNGSVGPYYRTPETDGVNWTTYAKGGSWSDGPMEMAYDSVNKIMYASTWGNGFLAMKTEGVATSIVPAAGINSRVAPSSAKAALLGLREGGSDRLTLSTFALGHRANYDVKGQLVSRNRR